MRAKQSSLPQQPVVYPVGTFVKTEKGYFYISKPGGRQRIISHRVLSSWSPTRVVETSETALSKYQIVSKMKFRNGTIIWCLSDGHFYLIESQKKRKIVSPDVFDRLDTNKNCAVVVSEQELNLHQQGEDIS